MNLERRIKSRYRPAGLLLLDDDEALLQALSATLENKLAQVQLDACQTAQEAISFLHEKPYDTIITDMNMPGMNGLEFVKHVNRIRRHTPVVLISGHADDVLVAKAFEAGIADFIHKPIDRDRLLYCIRRTMYISRRRRLLNRQQAALSKAKQRYLAIIDQLGDSASEWAQRLHAFGSDVLVKSLEGPRGSGRSDVFGTRSTQQLAALDAFMMRTIEAANNTLADVKAVQHSLRLLSAHRQGGNLRDHVLGREELPHLDA